jgi:hypothetical protein
VCVCVCVVCACERANYKSTGFFLQSLFAAVVPGRVHANTLLAYAMHGELKRGCNLKTKQSTNLTLFWICQVNFTLSLESH